MVNGTLRGVLGDAGVKKHLQQHVSEFLTQFVGVAATHRVEHLVGLFEQVAAQRIVRLLAFPRPGRAQLVHHRHRVDQPLARRGLRRRDQLVACRQPRLDRGMIGVRRQQDRRGLIFRRAGEPGRAAGSDHGTLTGISSVYCTSPASRSIASTGTSEGRRGSTSTTVISPAACSSSLLFRSSPDSSLDHPAHRPHLRTSLYQYFPGVFHRGPAANPRPSQRVQDHECAARRRLRRHAESAPAPSTSSRGSSRSGTAA